MMKKQEKEFGEIRQFFKDVRQKQAVLKGGLVVLLRKNGHPLFSSVQSRKFSCFVFNCASGICIQGCTKIAFG